MTSRRRAARLPDLRVHGLAVRSRRGGPMIELDEVWVREGRGLEGDLKTSARRNVTLIDRRSWAEAMAELGCELPWHTRRANVLVEGLEWPALLGQHVRLGDVEIVVLGPTAPCEKMDAIQPGLLRALRAGRGGVFGRVLNDALLRVGDPIVYPQNVAASQRPQ